MVNEITKHNKLYELLEKIFLDKTDKILDIATYMMMSAKESKRVYPPQVLRELNKLCITKVCNGKYHQRYSLTKKQKDIFKALNMSEADYSNYIKKTKNLLNN